MKRRKKVININKTEELKDEWPDNEFCPCGSGKKYRNCCKNKNMVYYKTKNEGEYIKSVPIHPEVEKAFKEEKARHKRLFGREVSQNAYVAEGIIEGDFEKMLKMLKRAGMVDNAWLYAVNKTGLMLSAANKNQVSDMEIKSFKEAMKEYKKAMRSNPKKKKINNVKAIELINSVLDTVINNNISDMVYVLRTFIRFYSDGKNLRESFIITDIKDFFVFCAYKTSIYLESIQKLLNEDCYDVVMGVDRIIFEILINIRAYKNNPSLFQKKILPVAGLDKGTHRRKGKSEIEEISTGKIYKFEIQKGQLAELAGENYKKLYDVFYRKMSEFIHLDTVAAKNIFKQNDVFFNIDESLIAVFIGMIFALKIVIELSEFDGCDGIKKSDMRFFSGRLLDVFINVLMALHEIEDKEVYHIMKDTLTEYKRK